MNAPSTRRVTVHVDGQKMSVIAPGLKLIRRRNGIMLYWVARQDARDRGYLPKTMPINIALQTVEDLERLREVCARLNRDQERWLQENPTDKRPVFNGTVASLIDLYLNHDGSPFHEKEFTTQATYRGDLKVIRETVGARRLDYLSPLDFKRWFNEWKRPAEEGGEERLARARKAITMLRLLMSFGVVLEIKDCLRLRQGLSELWFSQPEPRRTFMTYEQAEGFVDKALELGEPRVALGHACQFELMLRQVDVIGKWRPNSEAEARLAQFRRQNTYWKGELTFENMSPSGHIVIRPTKTKGALVEFDLSLYPLVQRCLAVIPEEERRGPFVVGNTGTPLDRWDYSEKWRQIANACGIPKSVWNMDNRASGVTEARNSGASLDDRSKHAAHASVETTRRIYDRSNLAVTTRVQNQRLKGRQ